jgi:hypothetical protein
MSQSLAAWDITDAHAHFFSHGFFKALLAQRAGGGSVADAGVAAALADSGIEAPPLEAARLARRWSDELDRHGVRQMVLMASVPEDWPSVAAALRAFPHRFIGTAMVNPLAKDAPAEVERSLGEGGLRGICLFPALHRFHVFDAAARAVIDVARRRRAVVFCHFGILKIPIRERLGLPCPFDGTRAVPTDLHRVAAEFPDVVFQVPHFGAGYLRETLLLGAQCPNVVVDTSSSNGWMRLSAPPLELEAVLRAALEAFGPQRILWGSDSSVLPRGWRRDVFEVQLEALRRCGLDDESLRAIFGGNARRVFGVD